MSSLPTDEVLRELIARGLIVAQPVPRALPTGNCDRLDRGGRVSCVVATPTGGFAKLTLGRDLGSLPSRHAGFARHCPGIATSQLFHIRSPAIEVLGETFFDGLSLTDALQNADFPQKAVWSALQRISHVLTATESASNEAARSLEWQTWSTQLSALPVWQPAERAWLRQTILPMLYARVASAPAATRWTNGDFFPGNILINSAGEVRVIDTEFASRTHFFAEDAVRFRVFSTVTYDRPDLARVVPSPPDLAWHLYFWLRQFQLESEHNTAEYLARFNVPRLGLIRHLVEHIFGLELTDWSVSALKAEYRVEDVRWSGEPEPKILITGWCCPPEISHLRAVTALGSDGRHLDTVLPGTRPDVHHHFGRAPRALHSGFSLSLDPTAFAPSVTLCAVIDQGTLLPFHTLSATDLPRGLHWDGYPRWAEEHDPDPVVAARNNPPVGPLFSILLPVFRTPEVFLKDCLRSVLSQHYPHWELCIVDDGSASPALTESLNLLAATDPRIRIKVRLKNDGISHATNDALAMAGGEFIILLDHDDLLRPHALAAFADKLGRQPDLDAIYSDEDKITANGRRILPFFKPDFSPEFLRGVMYIGHALCVRTKTARAVGGFDPVFDGVQDFEFFLRLTEQTRRIGHIPRILYHWRQSATSSALVGNVKGNMDEKQAAAVQAHLERLGDSRRAVALGGHRVHLAAATLPTHELIRGNGSDNLLLTLQKTAISSQADVLVFLEQTAVPQGSDWLHELVALAALSDSGCVAPVFLSADGSVRESGRTRTNSIMHGFHAEGDGYHGTLRCNREVDGVSPHCIAIKRTLVLDLSAASPPGWPEFCRMLRSRGFFHRVCAGARVQLSDPVREVTSGAATRSEPHEFFNPHFDPSRGDYTLAPVPGPQSLRTLRFNVDQPRDWNPLSRCIIVRGWCFASDAASIHAVRLRTGALKLAGVIGLPRPDVKTALADAPDDNTGFEIRGTLPSGRLTLHLEAQLDDGSWRELVTRDVTVKRQILPLWLGGGDWMALMFFQMPAHMAYAPRPIAPERFPRLPQLTRPKITVVTPSFNQARFLPETMHSVLDQVDIGCEYVVQDGGSNDGSAELIESQAHRLKAWASARDDGQADAIAKGFAKTSGSPDDLMSWINSDDFYMPGALAFVAGYFARHPEVDVVYGHRIVVNEASQEIARWFLPKHDPEVLRLNDFVPQETLFWRRRIWDKVGGIDTSFKFAMDWDLLLRFQAAGAKIVRVPHFLACFRVHTAQKTSARMHDIGREEITHLRERTHGRPFPPRELEANPRLLRYLRRSAFIGFLWQLRFRAS